MSLTRFVKSASPLALTILGGIGVIGTAVLAARAVPKAERLLGDAQDKQDSELSTQQKALAVAPAYLPAVGAGAATLLCIFGANALNKRQQASLVSALGVVSATYGRYKDKVIQMLGIEGDINIEREIAKDLEELEGEDRTEGWDNDKIAFYEENYGKIFEKTREEVFLAMYKFSRNITLRGEACLNEFYYFLGLPMTEKGGKVGWVLDELYEDGIYWLDINLEAVTMDDGMEVVHIIFPWVPVENYWSDWEPKDNGDYDYISQPEYPMED